MAAGYLVRQRLIRELQRALASGHVLVEAAAGYGKTVLLQHLAARRPDTFYFPIAPADLDIARLRARLQPWLAAGNTLLLDDVHLLRDGADALDWLGEQLQQQASRWVLVGRQIPVPVPGSAPVTRLSDDHLAFSLGESRALLGRQAEPLPEIEAWHERLKGWPIGVDLLARLPQGAMPLPALQAHIFPYLAQAVIAPLPGDLHRFLEITAVPLRFNDELAAHVVAPHLPGHASGVTHLREELLSRNLFLYASEETGWFQYHDLFRTFLLERAPDTRAISERVVAWFEARGDEEMAIEHALLGGLSQRAADLLLALPETFLSYECRYLTFRRWVGALDEQTQNRHPSLMRRVGAVLHYVSGGENEAEEWLLRAREQAQRSADVSELLWTQANLGRLALRRGRFEEAEPMLREVLVSPHASDEQRLLALRVLFVLLTEVGRFRAARPVSHQYTELAARRGDHVGVLQQQHNLAAGVLLPLGDFETATPIMWESLQRFTDTPSWHVHYLLNWCELCVCKGDWEALARALDEIVRLEAALEAEENIRAFWTAMYQATDAIRRGDYALAGRALAPAEAVIGDFPWSEIMVATLQVWAFRRQGQWSRAIERAEEVLAKPLPTTWDSAPGAGTGHRARDGNAPGQRDPLRAAPSDAQSPPLGRACGARAPAGIACRRLLARR